MLRLLCALALLSGCRLGLDFGDAFRDAGDGGLSDPDRYAAAVLADTPLLYLRFDEPDGQQALDSSGHDRDGSLVGGVERTGGAFAVSAGALRFHQDGAVVVPDDKVLRLNDSFSIELWFRIDELVDGFPGLVRKGNADTGTGYIVYYQDGEIVQPYLKRASEGFDGNLPLSTDRYYHLVVSHDAVAEHSVWYVDGIATDDDLETFPTNEDDESLSLGRGDQGGEHTIDEVAIYDVALTAAEVAAHVNAAGGAP